MSVRWVTDRVGYDGDLMYAHVEVDYWQPREDFEQQMDRQLKAAREQMLIERDRLSRDMDDGR